MLVLLHISLPPKSVKFQTSLDLQCCVIKGSNKIEYSPSWLSFQVELADALERTQLTDEINIT